MARGRFESSIWLDQVTSIQKTQGELKSRLDDVQGRAPTTQELREISGIQERFDPIYIGLEAGGAPPPRERESAYTYERRLLGQIAQEVASVHARNAGAQRRGLTESEAEYRKWTRSDLYNWDRKLVDVFGPEIIDGATRLIADINQGSFRNPGRQRLVERVGTGGHVEREWRGDNAETWQRFMHPGQSVKGGWLSRMMADPTCQPPPSARPAQRQPALPAQLQPSASLAEMISSAVRAALPAGRGRSRQK
jgi:hypothetical protein